MTGCDKGNERLFVQWLLNGISPVVSHRGSKQSTDVLEALEAVKANLLSVGPKSPMEAMLIAQFMATHELAMAFPVRALQSDKSEISNKLIERYARISEVACRQAETIQKLRGESGKSTVVVHHMQFESGAKGVVAGQITPGG
jgi:hypothetical protein